MVVRARGSVDPCDAFFSNLLMAKRRRTATCPRRKTTGCRRFITSTPMPQRCRSSITPMRRVHAGDGATVTRRAFAQGEHISVANRYFATDHLGSIIGVTDSAGAVIARYSFDPWGRETVIEGTNVTNVGFTGHQLRTPGALLLSLYRAYDPALGRWISEDPLKFVDGPNTLAYVQNNPTGVADPLGLSAKIRCEAIKNQGYLRDLGLRLINARHCYLDVECPGKYSREP
jgi:RHS repeat-associated protein